MTKAWHLRQDGKYFPVPVHMYVTNDDDFSSEAEAASFLIYTNSKDIQLAEYVLDIWMALLIENFISYDATSEDIDSAILSNLASLSYKFNYPLSDSQYLAIHHKLNNYYDVDSLYDFIDDISVNKIKISNEIRTSLNQQFCRVRYGGQYDSHAGNRSIWFRISSVSYNWANTIYLFVSCMRRSLNLQSIYICRDYESDNWEAPGQPEYFYKAKNGKLYFDMPIEEYLAEEHEHSPVFSSELNSGVWRTLKNRLASGHSYYSVIAALKVSGVEFNSAPWRRLVHQEQLKCIDCSEFLENACTRTQNKLMGLMKRMKRKYPEIRQMDVDVKPYPNRKGNMVGLKYLFEIESDIESLDHLIVGIAFTRNDATPDMIFSRFCKDYEDYKFFNNIRV